MLFSRFRQRRTANTPSAPSPQAWNHEGAEDAERQLGRNRDSILGRKGARRRAVFWWIPMLFGKTGNNEKTEKTLGIREVHQSYF